MDNISSIEKKVNCWCIANTNGICRVENCNGEIRQIRKVNNKDPYTAAKYYNISIMTFEEVFSKEFEEELENDID